MRPRAASLPGPASPRASLAVFLPHTCCCLCAAPPGRSSSLPSGQDGLQVLHCVAFPRPLYDLPILGCDLVSFNGKVSLGIIDLSPLAADKQLPDVFASAMRKLIDKHHMAGNREVPEWGKAIFSDYCVCIRPKDDAEAKAFVEYAIEVINIFHQVSAMALPVKSQKTARVKALADNQRRYCEFQQKNDKTSVVLGVSFGEECAASPRPPTRPAWEVVDAASSHHHRPLTAPRPGLVAPCASSCLPPGLPSAT